MFIIMSIVGGRSTCGEAVGMQNNVRVGGS